MRFQSYEVHVDGARKFNKQDMKDALDKKKDFFNSRAFFYVVSVECLEDRFLWISCDYDNANKFNENVFNHNTFEKQANPKSKEQVEPRQQVFMLYDTSKLVLYISDLNRRPFFTDYLGDILQKEIKIKPIYGSVETFCETVKTIKELRFTQVDNFMSQQSDIFTVAKNMSGLDIESLQVKVGFGDVPVNVAHPLLSRIKGKRDQFENVIVVGTDECNVEQTFDYSSVLKHIEIHPVKDENERYDPSKVKSKLLQELRNSRNV